MASTELSRMHSEYGKEYAKKCGNCCNYRKKGCCIAYGEVFCGNWSPDGTACKLYNRPFSALRPKRVELGIRFTTHTPDEENSAQMSIFG